MLEQRQEAQIALAGRSNVGKSSLVNALARRKQLAKISATPGKTRSINFYRVAPDGFSLVDLPGYGYAKCSQEERKSWAKLIEYYLTNTPTLKALALLLDCRIPPQALDRDLADFARGHGIPLLPVLTKADKCTQVERSKRQRLWRRLPQPPRRDAGRVAERVHQYRLPARRRVCRRCARSGAETARYRPSARRPLLRGDAGCVQ